MRAYTEQEKLVWYQSLPRKRMSAGALILRGDQILILNPAYKDTWEIPGGVVEANESPLTAVQREVAEETGLEARIIRPLCFDYQPDEGGKGDAIHFIFLATSTSDLGVMVDGDEIVDYAWVKPLEAVARMSSGLGPRVALAIRAIQENMCYACEGGKIGV